MIATIAFAVGAIAGLIVGLFFGYVRWSPTMPESSSSHDEDATTT